MNERISIKERPSPVVIDGITYSETESHERVVNNFDRPFKKRLIRKQQPRDVDSMFKEIYSAAMVEINSVISNHSIINDSRVNEDGGDITRSINDEFLNNNPSPFNNSLSETSETFSNPLNTYNTTNATTTNDTAATTTATTTNDTAATTTTTTTNDSSTTTATTTTTTIDTAKYQCKHECCVGKSGKNKRYSSDDQSNLLKHEKTKHLNCTFSCNAHHHKDKKERKRYQENYN